MKTNDFLFLKMGSKRQFDWKRMSIDMFSPCTYNHVAKFLDSSIGRAGGC